MTAHLFLLDGGRHDKSDIIRQMLKKLKKSRTKGSRFEGCTRQGAGFATFGLTQLSTIYRAIIIYPRDHWHH